MYWIREHHRRVFTRIHMYELLMKKMLNQISLFSTVDNYIIWHKFIIFTCILYKCSIFEFLRKLLPKWGNWKPFSEMEGWPGGPVNALELHSFISPTSPNKKYNSRVLEKFQHCTKKCDAVPQGAAHSDRGVKWCHKKEENTFCSQICHRLQDSIKQKEYVLLKSKRSFLRWLY